MTKRKKKILTIQILLLFIGIIIIYLTYYNKERNNLENTIKNEKILNEEKNLDLNQNVSLTKEYFR